MTERKAYTAAWDEARGRVFGGGLDRSFFIVLGLAYVAGAIFLAQRGGGLAPLTLATGAIAMALFLAMPILTIFAYVLALSFLAHLGAVPDDADPPMRLVIVALAAAIGVGALFVTGAFALPAVGAQLRIIFS